MCCLYLPYVSGSPEDKELMSQILIAGQQQSQARIDDNNRQGMLLVAHSGQGDVAGKGGHAEVGSTFPA